MIPVQLTPVVSQIPNQANLPPVFQTSQVLGDFANVPNAIAVLPAGTILKGFVLNRDPSGSPVLRTNYGDFLLKSSLFLKIGVDVTVKIEASGRNFRAAITEVDGKSVSLQTNSIEEQETQLQSLNKTTQPQATNTQQNLRAVILSPSPEAAANPLIKPGAALLLQITSASFPGQLSEEIADELVNFPQKLQLPKNIKDTQEFTKFLNVSPALVQDAKSSIRNLSETRPLSLTGIVIGQESDGEPVISTPLGLIKITSYLTLPTGTQVSLKITQANQNIEIANLGGEIIEETPLSLARNWQNMQTLIDIINQDSELSSLFAAAKIVNFQTGEPIGAQTAKISSGILFFVSALQGGNIKSLFGERMLQRLEEKGFGKIINKVDSEFSGIKTLNSENSQNSWQTIFMPFVVNSEVQMLRMFSKKNRKNEGNEQEGENTRFIVELEMTQLGEMQLDGLVRNKKEEKPYIELIIRAHKALPPESQAEIIDIFQNYLKSGEVEGALHFQFMSQFPINPLNEAVVAPPDIVA